MDQLPAELLMKVCDHLPKRDLRNYRLVSRTFSAAATPRLFHQLQFHASNASFNRILAVATHPVFRKYVEILVWDANMWDCVLPTLNHWNRRINAREKMREGVENGQLSPDFLALETYESPYILDSEAEASMPGKEQDETVEAITLQQFTIYQQRTWEERGVMKHQLGGDVARDVFCRFSNLKMLKMMTGQFHLQEDGMCKPWGRWGPEIDYSWANNDINTRGLSIRRWGPTDGSPGHNALVNGILSMGDRLTHLEINHLLYASFEPSQSLNALAARLPKLKSLELHIMAKLQFRAENYMRPYDFYRSVHMSMQGNQEASRRVMGRDVLKLFIAGLKSLSELSINIHSCPSESKDLLSDIHGAFCDNTIPANIRGLTSLKLHGINTTQSYFTDLLLQNAETLASIQLGDIIIKPKGSWKEVLYTMRSRLQLNSISFQGHLIDRVEPNTITGPYWRLPGYIIQRGWRTDHFGLGKKLEGFVLAGGKYPLTEQVRTKLWVYEDIPEPGALADSAGRRSTFRPHS